MNKKDDNFNSEVVDALFKVLSNKISLGTSLYIDEIGLIGAHERKGANKEPANNDGTYPQKNLSIFFHPHKSIKKQVARLVDNDK